jgi:hypothetical protein
LILSGGRTDLRHVCRADRFNGQIQVIDSFGREDRLAAGTEPRGDFSSAVIFAAVANVYF